MKRQKRSVNNVVQEMDYVFGPEVHLDDRIALIIGTEIEECDEDTLTLLG